MLSEGYLCGIPYFCDDFLSSNLYRKRAAEEKVHEMSSTCGFTYSSMDETQGRSLFQRCRSVGKFFSSVHSKGSKHNGRQKETLLQVIQSTEFERQTSPVGDMSAGSTSRDTYLVPSSCKSICKNYNDLHIAGGHVMPISSVTTDFTCDSGIGPFLESSEIPPPMESMRMPPNDLIRKPIQGYSSCWRVTSIMQHQQPLSNSILNDYLEQKVVELYKQYIMDSMVNSASPTQILASELIMTNVDQISMQISRERNMETTKAKDMVINCLLRLASGKVSSEISTPSLQISQ
ncbi:TLR adapter interacting with SLC15A4 on the lysosome [Gopherus flavomarginatus]|uniref:TLR adapter interacting with SLC15A4 on the lysosome n=1 Tax=Gopherus flavomarginatus TaxID=286002 RepID=UPI0021CC2056|nr:TLR adapter interacting with SLC15A4 on the lysosome [Gopherus flavomarginatus]XP_050792672.1 TLR adapter interacting with SLC15A4 on the lysosome [Gopherus flavomarginatus]XP_050792673.1 TLR adapter interacting with SLC15A4 on the lysosome [Gopherus flavomarginatus]